MNVCLTSIEEANGVTMVTAVNDLGKVRGVWHYDKAPVNGGKYMIEFTFSGNENADIDISGIAVVNGEPASFFTNGVTDTFTAECEDIDEDEDGGAVLYLRFAADGLEMLAVNGRGSIKAGDMLRFSFPCDEVGIYPYLEI